MLCWTSGKQMAVGITIIQVSGCAATSILTIKGVMLWIPLSLESIPGRTRHIHVKVQVPGKAELTTQLYFPGEARNDSDGIFSPALLMQVQQTNNGQLAMFNFVIAIQ